MLYFAPAHKSNRIKRLCCALLLVCMVCFVCTPSQVVYAAKANAKPTMGPANPDGKEFDLENPSTLLPEQLYAESAILIDQNSGKSLFEKDADQKMYPASTTKIMTLLLAIEYGHLDEKVIIPEAAAEVPAGSSIVPIQVGEEMTFRDLLYGFMLRSGNDAANAIAVIVGGSTENFAQMMNKRAQALGCSGTHFNNAHGFFEEEHYTTARDLSMIAREAMKNELFRTIVSTPQYTMGATNKRDALVVANNNQFALHGEYAKTYSYEYSTGIKTGFTNKSGHTFVGSASKNGVDLISVVLRSNGKPDTAVYSQAKWIDSRNLMEYGFARYKPYPFAQLYALRPASIIVKNADPEDELGGKLQLSVVDNQQSESFSLLSLESEINQTAEEMATHYSIEYTHNREAPISTGDIIGKLNYTDAMGNSFTTTLLASRKVQAAPPKPVVQQLFTSISGTEDAQGLSQWIWIAAAAIVAFIVLLIVLRHFNNKRRRRRYQQRMREEQARRRQNRDRNRTRYYQ